MTKLHRDQIEPFIGDDRAVIRELASPRNSPLTRLSVAEIRHPLGTCSAEHYHSLAEEIYLVRSGKGTIRIDGETQDLIPGDLVIICPGQRHKVCQDGEEDLVLVVICAPAYSVSEVVFTE